MQQQKTAPLFTNHQLLTLLWPLVIEQALEVLEIGRVHVLSLIHI